MTTVLSMRTSFVVTLCLVLQMVPSFLLAEDMSISSTAKEELIRCVADPEQVLSCGTAEVVERIKGRTGQQVMDFYEKNLPVGVCHTLGHIVGREVFKRVGDLEVAMSECGYTCGGACVHGIAGAAFLDALDIEMTSTSDVHVDPQLIDEKGGKLCRKSRTVCHGIGHMLFQIYNEFDASLKVCDNISHGAASEDCYRGIFMEHADVVSSHNILLADSRRLESDPQDLLYPCDSVDEQYRHACFRYQPRIQNRIFDEQEVDATSRNEFRRDACASLHEQRDRSSCFEGIGRNMFAQALTDVGPVRTWCTALEYRRDRMACVFGVARPLASYGHPKSARAFCREVPGIFERSWCYYAALSATLFVSLQSGQ